MGKKRKEPEATSQAVETTTYQPGALSSFLLGNRKVKEDDAGGLFSASTKAKFEPSVPLPGLQYQPKPKKSKKGKERPPRPTKREKEEMEAVAAEGGAANGVKTPTDAAIADDDDDDNDDEKKEEEEREEKRQKQLKREAKKKKGGEKQTDGKDKEKAEEKDDIDGKAETKENHVDGVASKKLKESHPAPPVEQKPVAEKATSNADKKKKEEEDSDEDGGDDEAGSEEKDARTIFVGNLPISVTKANLMKLFKQYGSIASVRLRSMALAGTKVDEHGNQRLVKKISANKRLLSDAKDSYNGYVVFKEEASVSKALAANNQVVEGKHIRVDRVGAAATKDPKRSIFLGNLPFDIKDEEVRAHFAAGLGSGDAGVEAVRLVRDPVTQMGKGFGFVLLKDRAAVAAALRLHESTLKGRKIRVTTCGKRNKESDVKDRVKPKHGAARRISRKPKSSSNTAESSSSKASTPTRPAPAWEGRRASAGGGRGGGGDAKLKALRLKKRGGVGGFKKGGVGGRGGGRGEGRGGRGGKRGGKR